uniref:Transcription factor Adf-1 n=1 Tax=Lygus hesperus TaxID=30085 RepID=A0A0A9ZH23_LYGHE
MTSERFSAEKDEMLIELVSRHPMLWNMENKEWKNQFKKDSKWAEIGRQMEKTSSQCKLRWKSIRDHYRKQRKQEKAMPTGSAAVKKRAAYWDRLQFLDNMEDKHHTFSNANTQDIETPAVNVEDLDDPPESQQLETSSQPPLSQSSQAVPPASSPTEGSDTFRKRPVKKAKTRLKELVAERCHDGEHLHTYLDKMVENEPEDENDLFFKTMALTVKKFKPALITQAKKRIFSIVMDLEEENQQT